MLPRGFPRRICYVPGWAKPFLVPRHIVRVDVDEPGLAGTHGWQVRYSKPSRFFSDISGRNRRNPNASLAEAIRYLAAIYQGPRNRCRDKPTLRKANAIPDAGIRLVERKAKNKTFVEVYIEACNPDHGRSSPKFYVGTKHDDGRGTVTPERLEAAKEKALRRRAELVFEHNRNKPISMR